jgi:hypothetical protein
MEQILPEFGQRLLAGKTIAEVRDGVDFVRQHLSERMVDEEFISFLMLNYVDDILY